MLGFEGSGWEAGWIRENKGKGERRLCGKEKTGKENWRDFMSQ